MTVIHDFYKRNSCLGASSPSQNTLITSYQSRTPKFEARLTSCPKPSLVWKVEEKQEPPGHSVISCLSHPWLHE